MEKYPCFNQQYFTESLSSATLLNQYFSKLSDPKLRRSWDITPSSSLDVKVMHFLSKDDFFKDPWLTYKNEVHSLVKIVLLTLIN